MTGTLRLSHLRFRAGPDPEAPPLEIEPSTVVVLIGPNDAGKSLALREIESWCTAETDERKVVETVSVDFPSEFDTALALIRPFIESPSTD